MCSLAYYCGGYSANVKILFSRICSYVNLYWTFNTTLDTHFKPGCHQVTESNACVLAIFVKKNERKWLKSIRQL